MIQGMIQGAAGALATGGAPGGSDGAAMLPPEARARVLVVVLGTALLVLVALIVLTVLRRWLWREEPSGRRRKGGPAGSAWEESGRRLATPSEGSLDDTRPLDDGDGDENGPARG